MQLQITALLFVLSTVHGLTLPPSTISKRQTASCQTSTLFDASCWEKLGVDNWLKKWNQTTPRLTADLVFSRRDEDVSLTHCKQNEPWTTCFLRVETKKGGSDCSKLNAQLCTWNDQQIKGRNGSDAAAARYALRAIYSVNNFFSTYYTALHYAIQATDLTLQSMISEIDRIKAESPLQKILSILVAAFAFLGAPSIGAAVVDVGKGVSAAVKTAAQGAFVSLQQTPGLVKSLWPTGTLESQFVQVGKVREALGDTGGALSQRIVAGLSYVMSDSESFEQFTSSGQWVNAERFSLDEQTDNLTTVFQYYMTSLVLAKNGWYGVLADSGSLDPGHYPTIDSVVESKFRKGLECDPNTYICVTDKKKQMSEMTIHYGYIPPDRNSAWWWSPVTHRLYALVKNDVTDQLNSQKVMQDVIGNNWASMEFLMDGAFNCTWQGRANNNENIDLWPDGQLDISCASQIPMKRTCYDKNCFDGSYLQNGKDCSFDIMDSKNCNRA